MLAIQTPTKIDQGLRGFGLEAKKIQGPGFTSVYTLTTNTPLLCVYKEAQLQEDKVPRSARGQDCDIVTTAGGEGHVVGSVQKPKEKKMDSQYFQRLSFMMEAKEKGDVLDAGDEASR
ncbi:hypothetical protein Tco_0659149 [Tanacetum coccineum]